MLISRSLTRSWFKQNREQTKYLGVWKHLPRMPSASCLMIHNITIRQSVWLINRLPVAQQTLRPPSTMHSIGGMNARLQHLACCWDFCNVNCCYNKSPTRHPTQDLVHIKLHNVHYPFKPTKWVLSFLVEVTVVHLWIRLASPDPNHNHLGRKTQKWH